MEEQGEAARYMYPGAEGLAVFYFRYRPVHGYLAAAVCVFGILANTLTTVVLTRPAMRSPTNHLLTALAVSETLTMAAYLPYALHFYCLGGLAERTTLASAYFVMFYACFSVTVHMASIGLTVTLAIFRYVYVKHPSAAVIACSLRRAKLAVVATAVTALVICIPNILSLQIINNHMEPIAQNSTYWLPYNITSSAEVTDQPMYIVTMKKSSSTELAIYTANFWIQGIVVKLIPCIILIILSVLIIRVMKQADTRVKRFVRVRSVGRSEPSVSVTLDTRAFPGHNPSRQAKTRRTTYMLVTIMALFVVTTLPHCTLLLLTGLLPRFQEEVYHPLGDILDIVALINNSINFILYCVMSKQFRDTFRAVFRGGRCCCQTPAGFQSVSTEPYNGDCIELRSLGK